MSRLSDFQTVQDHAIHHAANFAAITIPVLSDVLNAPRAWTNLTIFLGVVWYCILIGERVYSWYAKWKSKHSK